MLMNESEQITELLKRSKNIAVVGLSSSPMRPSYGVSAYLQSHGYKIIPVNPKGGEMFGEPVRASLADVDEPIDVVDVFRPSEETPEIAREAVKAGAKVLWLQTGIQSDEAERIAREGGLTVVMNTCMGATHRRLGLGPGPD